MAPCNQGSKAKEKGKASAVNNSELTVAYANSAAEITLTFVKGK